MKISGSGLPPEGVPAPDAQEPEGKAAGGKGFAEAVGRTPGGAEGTASAEDAARAAGAGQAAALGRPTAATPATTVGPVADVAADLRAGKISAQAAIEKVI